MRSSPRTRPLQNTVLVAAASRHGSTAEIAARIGHRLSESLPYATWRVDVLDSDSIDSIEDHDAVVLGSAIYLGHWLKSAKRLLDKTDMAPPLGLWIFGSGPANDGPPDAEPVVVAVNAAARLGAKDNVIFSGRIDLSSLGHVEHVLTNAMRVAGGDFRDWELVDAWANGIARKLLSATPSGRQEKAVRQP